MKSIIDGLKKFWFIFLMLILFLALLIASALA